MDIKQSWIWIRPATAFTLTVMFVLILVYFNAWDWSPTLIIFIIWDGHDLWKALRERKNMSGSQ
jgi:hypothetical protein